MPETECKDFGAVVASLVVRNFGFCRLFRESYKDYELVLL